MKKSLIALAVFGAFSGAALAQSNVTLYGILDVNYQRNDPSEDTCYTNFSGPGGTLTVRFTDGLKRPQSGNRFGLGGRKR
jgi:predicted porin